MFRENVRVEKIKGAGHTFQLSSGTVAVCVAFIMQKYSDVSTLLGRYRILPRVQYCTAVYFYLKIMFAYRSQVAVIDSLHPPNI